MKTSRELLEKTVKRSNNFADLTRNLGLSIHSYWFVKLKLQKFGIDYSHFRQYCYHKYSKEDLEQAVKLSFSYMGVARCLDIAPVGGNTCHLRDRIKESDIDVSHFLGQAHNKGRVSKKRKSAKDILKVYPKGFRRIKALLLRRALTELGREKKCEKCGLGEKWENELLRLHIDHIDGIYLNCLENNLRYLCPNCHSQTKTFGNKGVKT